MNTRHKLIKNTPLLFLAILLLQLTGCGQQNISLAETKPLKIACVGNSITYGAGMANREKNNYPTQLQHMLGPDYEVKNFGVSGRTLLKNGDLPYWETPEYQQALAYKADLVFIKLGTNDSKQKNRAHLKENFIADYKALINAFKAKNDQVQIVLLLPVPSFLKDTTAIWDPVLTNEIRPYTQQVALDMGLPLIDLYQLFAGQPNLLPDEIHPSSLGATIIARRVYEEVKKKSAPFDILAQLGVQQAEKTNFHGFEQFSFTQQGLQLKVVKPKAALPDRPWVWRARFFGHQPQLDIALLERGYHIVYCDVATYFGNKAAVARWNKCYDVMLKAGLHPKPVLEGMSRGGLIIYNWAAENLDKVSCIYADAPVLDGHSWPAGFGKSAGSSADWEQLKQRYNLASDSLPPNFKGWPIHKAGLFAKAGIPLLHVCGDADQVVPFAENTATFKKAIEDQGGQITTITKTDMGHHPHSLENPTKIVDFILRATGHKTNFAAIMAPGSEYRAAAGWAAGKGWWSQAAQIDSLCQNTKAVDLLLIGNSITQGWGGPRSWVTYSGGKQAAEQYFKNLNWIGAGISGDRTQHIAWRLAKGHYDQCKPKVVSLAIGVNNFPDDDATEIVAGLKTVLALAVQKFPDAKILFFGPLPAGLSPTSDYRKKYRAIHAALAQWNYPQQVHYHNLEGLFSHADGHLNQDFYGSDGIHLKPMGYDQWGQYIGKHK